MVASVTKRRGRGGLNLNAVRSLAEVGRIMGLSKLTVYREERAALAKLRKAIVGGYAATDDDGGERWEEPDQELIDYIESHNGGHGHWRVEQRGLVTSGAMRR